MHVRGCPCYVLDPQLQDGHKLPKWKPQSCHGMFGGFSPRHSSLVPLVLNPQTGKISPQFHVVFDNWFTSVLSVGADDALKPSMWQILFSHSRYHYMFDDHDAISLSDDWTDPRLQNVLDDHQHQLNQLPHRTGLLLQRETDNVSSSKPVNNPTLTPNPLPPLDPTLIPGGLPDAAVPSQAWDPTPAVPSQARARLLQSHLWNLLLPPLCAAPLALELLLLLPLFAAPLALELLPFIGDTTRRMVQGTKPSEPFVLLWLMPIMHKRILLLWLGIPLPKLTITDIFWSIRPPFARTLTYPDMLKHSRDLTVKDSMKGCDKRLRNLNPRTLGHLFFAPRCNSMVASSSFYMGLPSQTISRWVNPKTKSKIVHERRQTSTRDRLH